MKIPKLIQLEAGIYRLKEDVQNPKPDRRSKYDWRDFPVWRKGTRLKVETQETAMAGVKLTWPRILIADGYSHQYVQEEHNYDSHFKALVPAMEREGRNLEALLNEAGFLDRTTNRSYEILEALMEDEVVHLSDVERAIAALHAKDEREAARPATPEAP